MRRVIVVALLMGLVLLAVCPPVLAVSFSFTTIDVPFVGACCTQAFGINDDGEIVGSYQDANGATHGFLDVRSNFTTVDVPGAIGTSANGVNERGEIVGSFTDGSGSHGFVKFKKKFTSIDFPGALATEANGINKRGQIVGSYQDTLTTHGFLRRGAVFSTIDVPGTFFTIANAIDTGGQIVGSSSCPFGICGFFEDDNVFTVIDLSISSIRLTNANGISAGVIVGSFVFQRMLPLQGFAIPAPGSSFAGAILQFPGSVDTGASGINSEGQIVGFYSDASGQTHGFLAVPQ